MDKYSESAAFAGVVSAMKSPPASPRETVLREAITLTVGARNIEYGPPTANMTRLAALIGAYFSTRSISTISAADAAAINVLIKLARVSVNPTHRDSWVDMAAYAAIGAEVSQTEKDNI